VQQSSGSRSVFRYQSGRVIALGRVMLAGLFLASVWLDRTGTPPNANTYGMLFVYLLYALALAAATWRNWWLDARMAAPGHLIDMAVFTAIVFSANGYTSPFFLFFVLPLLSAAIRWGWRETGTTAAALVVLYMAAGLLVSGSEVFELQRFLVRSGHLMILSLILIWFGIHQTSTRLFFRVDDFEAPGGRQRDPLARALGLAMDVADARSGALLLRGDDDEPFEGPRVTDESAGHAAVDQPLLADPAVHSLLFDVARQRTLAKSPRSWSRFASARQMLNMDAARELGLGEGLVAEVRSGTGSGWVVLWDLANLSTDYVDLGLEIARVTGAFLDRHALLDAIERGAATRTRLSLARDVHDGVVQFLAGTAFRIEAIKRSATPGTPVVGELDELKRLVIDEQSEIRGVVVALRREGELEFGEAVAQLSALAGRLSDQWSIACRVEAADARALVPIRLHLDLQQLLREAVANAVRHGSAGRIDASLAVSGSDLLLDITDNGSGFPSARRGAAVEPRSLKERVERAHGTMHLVSRAGSTTISIHLPLGGGVA
jgi:signal transduction histidine kinase